MYICVSNCGGWWLSEQTLKRKTMGRYCSRLRNGQLDVFQEAVDLRLQRQNVAGIAVFTADEGDNQRQLVHLHHLDLWVKGDLVSE